MNRKYVLAAVGAGAGVLLLAGGLAFAQSGGGNDGARRHGMGMGMGMGGQEGMQRGMHRGRGMQDGTGQATDDSNDGRADGHGHRCGHGMGGHRMGGHGMGGHGMGRHGMGRHGMDGGEGASGQGMGRGHGMGGGHGMGRHGSGRADGTGPRSGAPSFEPAALAALKSELGITSAQEAAWSRYEKAAQAFHAARTDRAGMDREAVRSMEPADRFAFVTRMREEMRSLGEELRAAGDALREVLDPVQREKAAGVISGDDQIGPGSGRRASSAGGAHRH